MRTLFLLNPTAGKADCTRTLPQQLNAAAARAGLAPEEYTIQVTNHAGHARELANAAAQQARQSGEELRVFTAGGDGTFNEALTGIYGYTNAAVGCLPFGSGNDFLRTFGTKEEFLDLDAQLAGGPVSIDLMLPQQLNAAAARAGLAPEEYTIQVTNHAGHARELANAAAQQARQSGEELRVFTAGGDGTFNEALTGIYGYTNAAVGCLPFGSGNDFLRTFGTKEEFLDLDAQLAGGPVSIDLMQTSLGLSATICAAGLDAQVAYGIPKFRRIPLCGGEMAYVLSIVEQLCGHIGRRVEYTIDGETLDVDCLMCAICNGRTYGGGFCAAPEAQPDDGWLDVYIIRKVSRVTIAKLLGMYKSGKHFQNGQLVRAAEPYFIYRRAKQVSLRAADGRGPIVATADGECAPKEQITVQVQPLAGRILLPKPAFERFAAQRTAQSAGRT